MEKKNTQISINKFRANAIILAVIIGTLMIPNTYEVAQIFSYGEIRQHWIGHNYVDASILGHLSILLFAVSLYYQRKWIKKYKDNISK